MNQSIVGDGQGMSGPVDAFVNHLMAESLGDLLLGLMRQGLVIQRPIAEP